jgi:geranylgeranyl reductase family protein
MQALVVGAGPAGATAARALALAGVTVQLLERSKFPRNKPCGGGISLRVLSRFPYLEQALTRIPTHRLSRLYLEGPDGDSTVVHSRVPAALMIRRVEFDALLVSLAREAGAVLIEGVDVVAASQDANRVSLTARDGRTFTAPVVIAADGVHSVTARRLGLHSGWPDGSVALDMMEESPRQTLSDLDPSTMWVVYGVNGGPGYGYVFPKRDHVNVGIGYLLNHYRHAVDAHPYDVQRTFVEKLRVRGVVEGESARAHFTPFLIPVGGPLRRPGRGRVILAGDAGGFVNGFTAEGIYYAMVSGEIAAKSVVESVPDGVATLARRYRRAVDHEIGAELRDSVLIQRYLFADPRRIAGVVAGARRAPEITRLIVDFASGGLSYRTLRRRVLAGAPLLGARLLWERLRTLIRPRPPKLVTKSASEGGANAEAAGTA